ncbi:conserved hypothetical protein [Thiomonas arsenitoxydans]|jgi:hypothetical protein|uniref:Uncharacterized protein n=1 Tax=Thiomonas arsenitoxydans (strain DSM 22701 / CIP 110005 / 3As) TaxID=426114 RepID=D6CP75_THIA3|nr:hypothetical protein THI_3778 [Thiomonas arsenitoxydans]CQR28175.1 conserved hypothetical protein [Thiomonas arsenitoxydans]CQR28176.1 conserved hypothetical protein [Thiomonas arsenitoxydans]CQR28680.1 conserved hypothetical protein [Thiomonas arsenitoxydans]CQR31158.1 conserved hypothetical protein [Thiomonas arsenitoxydans]
MLHCSSAMMRGTGVPAHRYGAQLQCKLLRQADFGSASVCVLPSCPHARLLFGHWADSRVSWGRFAPSRLDGLGIA